MNDGTDAEYKIGNLDVSNDGYDIETKAKETKSKL